MIVPGEAVIVVGPSGTGKSTLAREALIEEGSGAVALAPGIDEWESYAELSDYESYSVRGFDDKDFAPLAGRFSTHGLKDLIVWLDKVYRLNAAVLEKEGQLRHKMIVFDTASGIDELIVARHMGRLKMTELPKARSADGGNFYSGVYRDWQQVMSLGRAMRGLGMHWLVLCHVKTFQADDESVQASGLEAEEQVMPLITGAFRNRSFGIFNLVLHSKIVNSGGEPVFVLQWLPEPRKATKSRYGALADKSAIPSDWRTLLALATKAKQQRRSDLTRRRQEE